jgi:hypothetical protein
MNLIEIYIDQVIKYLPPAEREDVKKELYAHILSMLDEDHDETDMKKVLSELGDPVDLADKYRDKKRYLIGPKYYHSYMKVLKLIIPIMAAVGMLAFFLDYIFANQNMSIIDAIAGCIISAIQAAAGVFTVFTIVFAVVEYSSTDKIIKKKKWNVEDLKKAEYIAQPIPKSEGIVSIIFSVLFFAILYYTPGLIGWYVHENGMLVNTPLFDVNILSRYMPLITLAILFGVLTAILKIVFGYWNIRLAVVNALNNIFSAIVWSAILLSQKIFNPVIFEKASQVIGISLESMMRFWNIGIKVLVVLIIIGCIADSISKFKKA